MTHITRKSPPRSDAGETGARPWKAARAVMWARSDAGTCRRQDGGVLWRPRDTEKGFLWSSEKRRWGLNQV